MIGQLIEQLRSSLATSDSAMRKQWATEIVERQIALDSLMVLWHGDPGTAQRFMWLIGDICELDPKTVAPSLPVLFEFRDGMPFPGMPRSVAKWLWLTNVPRAIEEPAIQQLFDWLEDPNASIGCKSYTAKALQQLALDKRIDKSRLQNALVSEIESPNQAYGSRMKKLLMTLEQ
ncbi:MAG: hypothetical protein ACR2NP_02830 [Pirellulaceae bacterium]